MVPAANLAHARAPSDGPLPGLRGQEWCGGPLKRAMDAAGALLGLAISLPLMLMLALLVELDSGGPVLFTQWRAGRGGRPFRIYKFRTMVKGAEGMLDRVIERSCLPPPVFKIPDDPRVTRVGKWLRRYSLDELPQFVNVLKGEMSLVGPRPEELRIVALYGEWHRRRLTVKPGMTGPMQVNGRGAMSLDQRVKVELDFIERENVWLDMELLARTTWAVLKGRGAF
jgi:lipopolysaccharide/colanic/teichoic acid biosynthesis glycosyltransferase